MATQKAQLGAVLWVTWAGETGPEVLGIPTQAVPAGGCPLSGLLCHLIL